MAPTGSASGAQGAQRMVNACASRLQIYAMRLVIYSCAAATALLRGEGGRGEAARLRADARLFAPPAAPDMGDEKRYAALEKAGKERLLPRRARACLRHVMPVTYMLYEIHCGRGSPE